VQRLLQTLLIFLTVLVIAGCSGNSIQEGDILEPRVTVSNIDIIDIGILEQRYGLTLRIQNPNQGTLQITGISFTIDINEHGFGDGTSDEHLSIPGLHETRVEVEVVSGLFDLVDQIQALEEPRGNLLSYRIYGTIWLSGITRGVRFEHYGEMGRRSRNRDKERAI